MEKRRGEEYLDRQQVSTLPDHDLHQQRPHPRQKPALFAFAAYNAAPGNLKRFRTKAKDVGLDQVLWFGNVENAAAAIIDRKTIQYVSNIYRYSKLPIDQRRAQRWRPANDT